MNNVDSVDNKTDLNEIKQGLELIRGKDKPDDQDISEIKNLDEEAKQIENNIRKQEIEDKEADRLLRKGYAIGVMHYLYFYSVFVAIFIFLSGFKFLGFSLESGVLTTLVGSTAVAAIGLVGFVVKGLFK